MQNKFILSLVFLFFAYSMAYSGVLQAGEFLEYNVSYLGVSIANIKVYCDGTENLAGKNVAKIRTNVFTYSHIPLVNAKAKMEEWIDNSGLFSRKYVRNLSIRNKPWEYQKIEFNYAKSTLNNNKWINNKQTSSINLKFEPNYRLHSPIGILFKVRNMARANNNSSILTYLDESPFNTNVRFGAKKEKVSVDGVSGKVRSVYCTGSANWQKQFGLTGGFEGWFSDDDARIPLLGKIDFIIGKVKVELVKYKRSGWKPPR